MWDLWQFPTPKVILYPGWMVGDDLKAITRFLLVVSCQAGMHTVAQLRAHTRVTHGPWVHAQSDRVNISSNHRPEPSLGV